MKDLYNVSGCPTGGVRCESCAAEAPDLAVHAVTMDRIGVGCLVLCPRCAASSVPPPVSVSTAARVVIAHAQHLGITVDELAAAMDDHA